MEFALISDWKRLPCEEAQLEEIYAKEFARLGHRIHWIAFIPGLPEPVRRETWHGHPVTLHRREDGIVRPLIAWLSALLKERPLDFVQVRNDPVFALIAGVLARRAGKPLVYHLSILNGPLVRDQAYEWRGLKRLKLLLKGAIGGFLVDRVALSCDLLLAISEGMVERYRALGRTGPAFALPMGCRDAVAVPPPPERPTVELLYLGSLDRVRRLDFLLRAVALARRSDPRLRLAFMGAAQKESDIEYLKRRSAELGLNDAVRFEAPVPRAEVNARIDAADIGVSSLPPTVYYRVSSPTKLMECLARGRPVVATGEALEQKSLLDASGGGLAVPFEEAAFAEAIVALSKDRVRRLEAGRRGAEYMAAHRDYSILAERALKAYRDFLGRDRA